MAVWPYNTAAWQRRRRLKLSLTPLCEYCPPGRITIATEVDHKQAIKQGGDPFALDNLASTCKPCHSTKTNAEDGGAYHARTKHTGVDPATGRPLDRSHPWNQEKETTS